MAAPIQLGKNPFSQEYRLIEPPSGAVITSGAFSLFCRTPDDTKNIQGGCVEEKPDTSVACRRDVEIKAKISPNNP